MNFRLSSVYYIYRLSASLFCSSIKVVKFYQAYNRVLKLVSKQEIIARSGSIILNLGSYFFLANYFYKERFYDIISNMYTLTLKKGEEKRILSGHPWVYANEVAKIQGKDTQGSICRVSGFDGRFIGYGFITICRKLS